jgi:hypothetical protein
MIYAQTREPVPWKLWPRPHELVCRHNARLLLLHQQRLGHPLDCHRQPRRRPIAR